MSNASRLKANTSYRVQKIGAGPGRQYRNKLLAMGLLPGTVFQVIRYAPFGNTLQIEVNGTALSLRDTELKCITCEECAA